MATVSGRYQKRAASFDGTERVPRKKIKMTPPCCQNDRHAAFDAKRPSDGSKNFLEFCGNDITVFPIPEVSSVEHQIHSMPVNANKSYHVEFILRNKEIYLYFISLFTADMAEAYYFKLFPNEDAYRKQSIPWLFIA